MSTTDTLAQMFTRSFRETNPEVLVGVDRISFDDLAERLHKTKDGKTDRDLAAEYGDEFVVAVETATDAEYDDALVAFAKSVVNEDEHPAVEAVLKPLRFKSLDEAEAAADRLARMGADALPRSGMSMAELEQRGPDGFVTSLFTDAEKTESTRILVALKKIPLMGQLLVISSAAKTRKFFEDEYVAR